MFAHHYWIKPSLFFNIDFCLFILYLVAPRLSCGTPDLWSSLGRAGLVVARELLVAAWGTWFPDQGSDLGPAHWDHGVLATGPLGKSPKKVLFPELTFACFICPSSQALSGYFQVLICLRTGQVFLCLWALHTASPLSGVHRPLTHTKTLLGLENTLRVLAQASQIHARATPPTSLSLITPPLAPLHSF